MSQVESGMALFDRLGGVPGVINMIDRFYARVLADPTLRPYFQDVEMYKLQRMQFEFFSVALGGPAPYSGRTVQHAHQGRRISREHFQTFVEHLFDTLKDYQLSDDDRYSIIAKVNTYADDVISGGAAASE